MFQPTFDQITQILQAVYKIPLGHSEITSTLLRFVGQLGGNNFQSIFVFNIFLLTVAILLTILSLNFKSKITQGLVLMVFILSPWVWQTAYSSTSMCLAILGLAFLVVLRKHNFLFWTFAILLGTIILPTLSLPLLKVDSYNYYVNLHRQADLYSHQGLLARLLYNRYIFTSRQIFLRFFSFFDWDRWTFVGSSGKAEISPYTAMQFTLLEIPLIIAGLWNTYLKNKKLFIVLAITALLVSLSAYDSNQAPFWFLLEVGAFMWLQRQNWMTKKQGFVLMVIILALRLITTTYTLNNQNKHKQILAVYQEMSNVLKTDRYQNKNIVITDRMGQPHIYLTYLGLINPADLKNSLLITSTKDNQGLLQPAQIDRFHFASFTDNTQNDLAKTYPDSFLIEFSSQFENLAAATNSAYFYRFQNPFTFTKGNQTVTDNLVIVYKP